MTKVFILINHEPTQRQISELKRNYGEDAQFVFPPESIKNFWAQIPPKPVLDYAEMNKIIEWLACANSGDVVFVQGDFGATFFIADYALKKKLVPIYAVTKRITTEKKDGEKVYKQFVFEHECFRKYIALETPNL